MANVVNTGDGALFNLGVGLSEIGRLSTYVAPPFWGSLPGLATIAQAQRSKFGHLLARRRCPPSLEDRAIPAAHLADLSLAAVHQAVVELGFGPLRRLERDLAIKRGVQVSRSAQGRISSRAHNGVTVANFGAALEALQAAKGYGQLAVLSYPVVHHDVGQRLMDEEATLVPSFASTLQFRSLSKKYIHRLDGEIREADRILVGSRFVRDSFVTAGVPKERVWVCNYGADLSLFSQARKGRSGGGIRYVFVGQVGQRKGLSYLLDAFSALRDPAAKLFLVGDLASGPVPRMGGAKNVVHVPRLGREALADFLADMDVIVLPSIFEGFPMSVLEAMAVGLPAIVTPTGADDIVRHGVDGFVVPRRDAGTLERAMRKMRDHPEFRHRAGMSARERTSAFSAEAFAERFMHKVDGERRSKGIT